MQRQMNRARGGSVIRRFKGTEHCGYVVTRVRIYLLCALLALKLSLARCYVGALLALRANSWLVQITRARVPSENYIT